MTTRRAVLAELKTRLVSISTSNGFNTDLGAQAFISEEPVLGPDDPPQAIAIVVGRDEITHQATKLGVRLPVTIAALAKKSVGGNPFETIEAALEDIKRAVELDPTTGEPDYDFGGLLLANGLERGNTAPVDRKDGSEFVGLTIEYVLCYAEKWGAP